MTQSTSTGSDQKVVNAYDKSVRITVPATQGRVTVLNGQTIKHVGTVKATNFTFAA